MVASLIALSLLANTEPDYTPIIRICKGAHGNYFIHNSGRVFSNEDDEVRLPDPMAWMNTSPLIDVRGNMVCNRDNAQYLWCLETHKVMKLPASHIVQDNNGTAWFRKGNVLTDLTGKVCAKSIPAHLDEFIADTSCAGFWSNSKFYVYQSGGIVKTNYYPDDAWCYEGAVTLFTESNSHIVVMFERAVIADLSIPESIENPIFVSYLQKESLFVVVTRGKVYVGKSGLLRKIYSSPSSIVSYLREGSRLIIGEKDGGFNSISLKSQ